MAGLGPEIFLGGAEDTAVTEPALPKEAPPLSQKPHLSTT